MEITPVEPIGKQEIVTLHGSWWTDEHPPPSTNAREFRGLRVGLGYGLRQTAKKLGCTDLEISSLERGRATCNWREARRLMLVGAPPCPARLRKSEWRWLAKAVRANLPAWFCAGDMLVHRLARRGLVQITDNTALRGRLTTAVLTPKGSEAFAAHPDDWGLPEGPRNCRLRRKLGAP